MIVPLRRELIVDHRAEPLGPGWLRRHPTRAETRELALDGVWRTGPLGRAHRALVTALDGANEVALVCSFLLADDALVDAMLRASQRGVRVYVLTASEQRIGKVVRDDEESFERRMAEDHKTLLELLAGNVLLRSAAHIHAKFLVTDPQSEASARAILSTANFNKALFDGIELCVALRGVQAQALAACFKWAFWCEAERELRGTRRLMEIRKDYPATPPMPNDDTAVATLRDHVHLRDSVMRLIEGAQKEIFVASYGLSSGHCTVRALIEAALRGVRVTVLTRPRPAVAAAVAALSEAGATIFAHDKLHAKALAVDGRSIVMTANLERLGMDENFEVGAVLSEQAAIGVNETLREWATTFPWVYRASATRADHLGDFCAAGTNIRDGFAVVTESASESLAPVTAADALALSDAPEPALPQSQAGRELPKSTLYTWDVVPPTLPKNAMERFRQVGETDPRKSGLRTSATESLRHEPRLFELGERKFVLIERDTDVDRARSVAQELGATCVVG